MVSKFWKTPGTQETISWRQMTIQYTTSKWKLTLKSPLLGSRGLSSTVSRMLSLEDPKICGIINDLLALLIWIPQSARRLIYRKSLKFWKLKMRLSITGKKNRSNQKLWNWSVASCKKIRSFKLLSSQLTVIPFKKEKSATRIWLDPPHKIRTL